MARTILTWGGPTGDLINVAGPTTDLFNIPPMQAVVEVVVGPEPPGPPQGPRGTKQIAVY